MFGAVGVVLSLLIAGAAVYNAPLIVSVGLEDHGRLKVAGRTMVADDFDATLHVLVTDVKPIAEVAVRCGETRVPMQAISDKVYQLNLAQLAKSYDPSCRLPGHVALSVEATDIDGGKTNSKLVQLSMAQNGETDSASPAPAVIR